jgi:hypothetical protein
LYSSDCVDRVLHQYVRQDFRLRPFEASSGSSETSATASDL